MCECGCCADALELLKWGRPLTDACDCAIHALFERCDCSFCVAVTSGEA